MIAVPVNTRCSPAAAHAQRLAACRRYPQSPGTARPRCKTQARAVAAAELIEEVDIVLYTSSTGSSKLGRVLKVTGDKVVLEPLVLDEHEADEAEEGAVFIQSEQPEEAVAVSSLKHVVQYELSQRQDKVSNPHGEHAHDIFRLLEPLAGMLNT